MYMVYIKKCMYTLVLLRSVQNEMFLCVYVCVEGGGGYIRKKMHFILNIIIVKPVYKGLGHSTESANMAFMCSCPLHTG